MYLLGAVIANTPSMQNPPVTSIESKIYLIRGHKVLLDSDLAFLYGVETKVLNQAVRRNAERFPEDFMFQLSENEEEFLRSQFVTSKSGSGGRRYRTMVFTEFGVAMLSSVLRSEQAIQVNIAIMRAFGRLREVFQADYRTWEEGRLILIYCPMIALLNESQLRHLQHYAVVPGAFPTYPRKI